VIERYTLPEMGRVWSEAHKYELWRRVETLVIANNRHLISLRGFRNLEHVDALFVSRNPRIAAQLGLFPALGRVEGAVLVHSNLGLSDHDLARLLARVSGRQS